MSPSEIHITNLAGGRGRRLYYYQGNFFHPMDIGGADIGIVKREIREFRKKNQSLVGADRADPGYKNLIELFDEQVASL